MIEIRRMGMGVFRFPHRMGWGTSNPHPNGRLGQAS